MIYEGIRTVGQPSLLFCRLSPRRLHDGGVLFPLSLCHCRLGALLRIGEEHLVLHAAWHILLRGIMVGIIMGIFIALAAVGLHTRSSGYPQMSRDAYRLIGRRPCRMDAQGAVALGSGTYMKAMA